MPYRSVVLLCFLFTCVLLAKTTGYVTGTNASAALYYLKTNPDGSLCAPPCLLGVQPGVAQYSGILQALERHPFIHVLSVEERTVFGHSPSLALQLSGGDTVYVYGDEKGSRVVMVALVTGKETATELVSGDMITAWGTPTSVGYYINYAMKSFAVRFIYPVGHITVSCDLPLGDEYNFKTPVSSIEVSDLPPLAYEGSPWRGFQQYPKIFVGP